jgi:hypothetical protein
MTYAPDQIDPRTFVDVTGVEDSRASLGGQEDAFDACLSRCPQARHPARPSDRPDLVGDAVPTRPAR